ncbi:MAG: helix-turn-helix domain-containing protein [Alphaproteobacteria bacterium]|nr:helix-turn-helix domain-containing protein [Alphaproteobacteria bacterium]
MEKEFAVSPRKFSFCLSLKETAPLEIYGHTKSADCIYVVPPDGEFVTVSPPNSLLMAITIDSQTLLNNAGLVPELVDWLSGLNRQCVFVKSLELANRMRADMVSALESLAIAPSLNKRSIVERATLFSIASALTMAWLRNQTLPILPPTNAYERFRQARVLLQKDVEIFDERSGHRIAHLGSKRSIEQAFTDHVSMGPLSYARLIRLHNARSKLRNAEHKMKSIGDIAAEEGFWDASRFAAHYRSHFGELPSATRQKSA